MLQNLIYGLAAMIIGIVGLCGTLLPNNKIDKKKTSSLKKTYWYLTIVWSSVSIVFGLLFLVFVCIGYI